MTATQCRKSGLIAPSAECHSRSKKTGGRRRHLPPHSVTDCARCGNDQYPAANQRFRLKSPRSLTGASMVKEPRTEVQLGTLVEPLKRIVTTWLP